jgi:hypothetical protein
MNIILQVIILLIAATYVFNDSNDNWIIVSLEVVVLLLVAAYVGLSAYISWKYPSTPFGSSK